MEDICKFDIFVKMVVSVPNSEVKVGRDGVVRQLNIAYKIIKEESWTHSVVTRAAREVIKLYEIGDTTFAEDIKAVHTAAKEILKRRGATTNVIGGMDEWPVVDIIDDESGTQVDERSKALHSDDEDPRHNTRHTSTYSSSIFIDNEDLCLSGTKDQHEAFLSCTIARDWYLLGADQESEEAASKFDSVLEKDKDLLSEDEELLFLI